MNIVYHGSSNGNIEEFKPHVSTHNKECIYASVNRVVAMLFMASGNGDLDTRISYDNNRPVLVERREGVLKERYNVDGYLYELDGSTFKHYDYLWGAEVISFEKGVKPLKKTYFKNVLKEIEEEEKKGNIVIYHYPNRPKDMPLDNSDLIDRYIRFEKMGHKGALDSLIRFYPDLKDKVFAKLDDPKELVFVDNKKDEFGKVIAYDNVLDAIHNGKFTKDEYNPDQVYYIYRIKGDIKRINTHSFEVTNVKVLKKDLLDNNDLIDNCIILENKGYKGSIDNLIINYPNLREQIFARLDKPAELIFIENEKQSFDKVIAFDNLLDAIENSEIEAAAHDGINDNVFVRENGYINYTLENGKFHFIKGYFNMDSDFYIYKVSGDVKRLSAHTFEVTNVKIVSKVRIDFNDYVVNNEINSKKI